MLSILKNNIFELFTLIVISIFYIFIFNQGGVPIIKDSQWMAILMNKNYPDIEIKLIYSLLQTPIYIFFKEIFINFKLYVLFSYLVPISTSVVFYLIIYKESQNKFLSLLVSSLIAIPYFATIFNIMIIDDVDLLRYPFGWFDLNMTTRSITVIIYMLLVYSLYKSKFFLAPILILLSFFIHPNNSINLAAITLVLFMYLVYKNEISIKFLIILVISIIVGLLPSIIKMYDIKQYIGDVEISSTLWYLNNLRNEPDDFSALYYVVKYFWNHIFQLSFVILSIMIYIKKSSYKNYILVYLSIIPWIIFTGIMILEYMNQYIKWDFFYMFIISPQFGHKILTYSFLPIILMWISVYKNHLTVVSDSKNYSFYYGTAIIFVMGIFFLLFYNKLLPKINLYLNVFKSTEKYYSYNEMLNLGPAASNKYEKFILDKVYKGIDNNITGIYNRNMYAIEIIDNDLNLKNNNFIKDDEVNLKYFGRYMFEDLIKFVESNISIGTGIIIPPYYIDLRDVFVNYPVFYQEKHDGNLILGSKEVMHIFNKRMTYLLDIDNLDLPGIDSGLQTTILRKSYLKINEDRLKKLKENYSLYKLFITEKEHKLSLPIIYEDNYFIIYELK